jgi:poly-gamma-glutamate synthesis protein (capsule biosynthesis protein)
LAKDNAQPKRRRRRTVAIIILVVLAALGGALYYVITTPMSQPCFALPDGAEPRPEPVEGSASGRSGPITLALAGDAMLGRNVDTHLSRSERLNLWRRLARALRGVDIFGFNLECAVTDADQWGTWKKFRFKMLPSNASRALTSFPLPAGAASFASIANNHVLDFGPEGLAGTSIALDQAGIAHAGSGPNATSAWRPAVITTRGGVRVGFLAVADHCGCLQMGQWVAGSQQPGIAYANLSSGRWDALLSAVAALDRAVDVVVVSLHSGPNWYPEGPPDWMHQLAEALVDAGADVIWSHSAHHVLPIEQIRGRHVIYGPGGLMDDYMRDPEYRNELGMVVRLTLSPEGEQTADVVPIRIRGNGPLVLETTDPDFAEVLHRAGQEPSASTLSHL